MNAWSRHYTGTVITYITAINFDISSTFDYNAVLGEILYGKMHQLYMLHAAIIIGRKYNAFSARCILIGPRTPVGIRVGTFCNAGSTFDQKIPQNNIVHIN